MKLSMLDPWAVGHRFAEGPVSGCDLGLVDCKGRFPASWDSRLRCAARAWQSIRVGSGRRELQPPPGGGRRTILCTQRVMIGGEQQVQQAVCLALTLV